MSDLRLGLRGADSSMGVPQGLPERPDLYGELLRRLLIPAWETGVRKRPTLGYLDALKRTQWCSADELHHRQSQALQRLVRHAYAHVPLYRGGMRAAGISDQDIQSPEDLLLLPILSRDDARAAGRARASTAPPLPTIQKQTSGTTGQPLLFGFEPDSEYWRHAVKLRAYEWAGYRPGDRVLHFWGAPTAVAPPLRSRAKVALDHWMKREIYVPCAVLDDETLGRVVQTIARERPRAIVCYAQAGAELSRFILRHGLRAWGTIPVICGAERLYPRDRADMVLAFGPAVFDTYGCREVMLIASECEAHDGMHVSAENLIVEILVTEANGRVRPAREGETGEVVVTDLHNLAMPFIRYANGDVATAGPIAPCGCGRGLPRLNTVQGRSTDMLRDARGAPVNGLAVSFLFARVGEAVRQFQLVQHADRSVTLRLVHDGTLGTRALAEIREGCMRLLRGVAVRVESVPELPRTPAGKHRLVIVEP